MIFTSILRALHHLGDIFLQAMAILAIREALICLEDRLIHLAKHTNYIYCMRICFIWNQMVVSTDFLALGQTKSLK